MFLPHGVDFFMRAATYDEPVIKGLLEARSILFEIVDG